MTTDVYEYTAYSVGDVLPLLLWGAACLAVFVFTLIQGFRLAVLITSALMDIEENDR